MQLQLPSQPTETNLLNLLIVDDERSMRESCREVAHSLGFNTQAADSPEHAYHALDTNPVDVVLLDLRLPGTGGLEVLREIKRRRPETLVIVMTGFATVQSAVQAMKLGAYDYITKPFNFDELRLVLERVTAHLKLTSENRLLREQLKSKHGFGSLVGHAPGDGEAVPHHRQSGAQHAIPSSSWARAAPARSWWRAPSTTPAPIATSRSSRWTAGRWCPA